MLYKAERRNRHGEENRAGAENGSTGAIQRGIADSKGLPCQVDRLIQTFLQIQQLSRLKVIIDARQLVLIIHQLICKDVQLISESNKAV